MASRPMPEPPRASTLEMIADLLSQHGSASNSYAQKIATHYPAMVDADVLDAAQHFALIYGQRPGVIVTARNANFAHPMLTDWFDQAIPAFTQERLFLTQLLASIGPFPAGASKAPKQLAVEEHRRIVATLAASTREGCAFGAAAALVLDWPLIRQILDRAALLFGMTAPTNMLPSKGETLGVINRFENPARSRAILFGLRQLLEQHSAIWAMLATRSATRQKEAD